MGQGRQDDQPANDESPTFLHLFGNIPLSAEREFQRKLHLNAKRHQVSLLSVAGQGVEGRSFKSTLYG
jgi:hypothetical protein